MPDLLLIPTELEQRFLLRHLSGRDRDGDHAGGYGDPHPDMPPGTHLGTRAWAVRLCGFGQVAAAARAATLIARESPRQIVLVGIAGSLSDAAPIGGAHEFTTIIADGIGVGSGTSFRSAGEMGWPHWPGEIPGEATTNDSTTNDSTTDAASLVTMSPRIEDRILCDTESTGGATAGLLSVCAASSDAEHAAIRRRAYPDAIAEEMEAFGVAVACRLAGVRLRVIRGISNRAGNRDMKNWKIESALAAAAKLVREVINPKRDSINP